MRAKPTHQIGIYEAFSKHEIGQELKAISDWLDSHVEVLDWVTEDIQRKSLKPTGRSGMSIESILRCGLLKLIRTVRDTLSAVQVVMSQHRQSDDWMRRAEHHVGLAMRAIDQAVRRVSKGETVPADEKVVSVFEPHTDIIVKGGRDTQYGHKLNLTTGKYGMVLDLVIEEGNPADSRRLLPMIRRIGECYGKLPRQVAADAGYASTENIREAKALGIKAIGLPKKRGMKGEDMTGSEWIYKKLKRFRAGIEGNISMLRRVFGLDRCTWCGLAHFRSYVMSAVLAYNFKLFVRLSQ